MVQIMGGILAMWQTKLQSQSIKDIFLDTRIDTEENRYIYNSCFKDFLKWNSQTQQSDR